MRAPLEPQVLVPFQLAEALTTGEAGQIAGVTQRTMRLWCHLLGIGRRIKGQWRVSKVALAMHLDGDREALALYLDGDRSSDAVVAYFKRCGVQLPKRHFDAQEPTLSEVNARSESEAA